MVCQEELAGLQLPRRSAAVNFMQCTNCATFRDDPCIVWSIQIFHALINFYSLINVHIYCTCLSCSGKRAMLTNEEWLIYLIRIIRTRNGGNSTKACSFTKFKLLSKRIISVTIGNFRRDIYLSTKDLCSSFQSIDL